MCFTGERRIGSVRFARVGSQAYPAVYVRVKLPVDSKLYGLITTVVLPAWAESGVKSISVLAVVMITPLASAAPLGSYTCICSLSPEGDTLGEVIASVTCWPATAVNV